MDTPRVLLTFLIVGLVGGGAYGIFALVKHEKSKPLPPLHVILNGETWQDLGLSKQMFIDGRQYVRIEKVKE